MNPSLTKYARGCGEQSQCPCQPLCCLPKVSLKIAWWISPWCRDECVLTLQMLIPNHQWIAPIWQRMFVKGDCLIWESTRFSWSAFWSTQKKAERKCKHWDCIKEKSHLRILQILTSDKSGLMVVRRISELREDEIWLISGCSVRDFLRGFWLAAEVGEGCANPPEAPCSGAGFDFDVFRRAWA